MPHMSDLNIALGREYAEGLLSKRGEGDWRKEEKMGGKRMESGGVDIWSHIRCVEYKEQMKHTLPKAE